ncbi:MAG: hypothetical protein HFH11_02950 [Dorea sp.]|nr:hypothetical protein [Dorea sp.]
MIRFAKVDDIQNIMYFIDKYWRKNHILSHDRKLFEFQHKWGEEVSFVISEKDGNITGLLGYIPYNDKNRDVTLAIWKTTKTEETMQGIKMLTFLQENGDIHTIAAPGINPKTGSIYKFLGLNTGKMKQWYRLRRMAEYKIAKVNDAAIPKDAGEGGLIKYEITSYDQAVDKFGIEGCLVRDKQLYKSIKFIKRRYFEHPTFTYMKFGLMYDDKKLFVVLRVQNCKNSALLRVIDCIGDHELLKYFTPEIDRLLVKYDCEYADCYEIGVNDEVFKLSGWKSVADSGNIMPDYFAPFEQRNIDIYYMSEQEGVALFKGDGDMDRPN